MKDFDTWTETTKSRGWIAANNATEIGRGWGFIFYENPITGDNSPVLAVKNGGSAASPVWNTQDMDVPTQNPTKEW